MSPRNIQFLCQKVAEEYIWHFIFKIFKIKQYIPQDLYICGKATVNRKGVVKTKLRKIPEWGGKKNEERADGGFRDIPNALFLDWVEVLWLFIYF